MRDQCVLELVVIAHRVSHDNETVWVLCGCSHLRANVYSHCILITWRNLLQYMQYCSAACRCCCAVSPRAHRPMSTQFLGQRISARISNGFVVIAITFSTRQPAAATRGRRSENTFGCQFYAVSHIPRQWQKMRRKTQTHVPSADGWQRTTPH